MDNDSEYSEKESLELSEKDDINYNKIIGFVKTINYLNNYSRIKEGIITDKYIIIFTDLFNIKSFDEKRIEKIFEKLKSDKCSKLILVGKNKKPEKIKLNDNEKSIENLILNKFGENSESIYFGNMKKIKTILSNNKVIKDEIFYPNEIYK